MKIRNFYTGGAKTTPESFVDVENLDPTGELILLWPTPIYVFHNDVRSSSWHFELQQEVRRRSVERTFRADWNNSDFFKWASPGCLGFSRFLRQHVASRIAFDTKTDVSEAIGWSWNGWVNILPQFAWHQPHIHEKSTLSFVYYLEVASNQSLGSSTIDFEQSIENGGILQLSDPRGSAPYMSCEWIDNVGSASVRVRPTEGLLCIFPSFLSHFVTPNSAGTSRTSIAGNVFGIKLKH